MATSTVAIRVSALLEAATGLALIANPGLVARLLLGADLSGSGVAVGRLCGIGLLSLGLASWPGGKVLATPATVGLFVYNLLAAAYIGYLGGSGAFRGYLLWPACVLHGVLALLLVASAYEAVGFRGDGKRRASEEDGVDNHQATAGRLRRIASSLHRHSN